MRKTTITYTKICWNKVKTIIIPYIFLRVLSGAWLFPISWTDFCYWDNVPCVTYNHGFQVILQIRKIREKLNHVRNTPGVIIDKYDNDITSQETLLVR
jgi:hypothetical protein